MSRLAVFLSFSGAGGVERMVTNLLPGFLAAGHAVDLIPAKAQNLPRERIPDAVRVVDLGIQSSTLAAPALARYLRRERPQAVLAAKDRAIRSAVIARALSKTSTRLVGRLGTNLSAALDGAGPIRRWSRYLPMRVLYRHVDAIVAVSEGVALDTLRITGIPANRVQVIRNPVVTAEIATLAEQPVTHPWLAPDQPPVILAAGRLTRQKDFPTLVRAFALLRQERSARLIILGDGALRDPLLALAAELGVAEDIDLPGHTPNPYAWMRRASLFVLSSAWEGSPNVLTEAIALGTPVVSTDCPSGPSELLDGGRYGPLVPVGNPTTMAAAMGQTLDSPLASDTLRSAAREYTAELSAQHYLRILGLQDA